MNGLISSYLQRLRSEDAAAGPVPVAELLAGRGARRRGGGESGFDGVPHGYWDGRSLYAVSRDKERAELLRWSLDDSAARFDGAVETGSALTTERLGIEALSVKRVHELLPHLKPSALRSVSRTIGTGDRLGLAGHGHASAFLGRAAAPVLAQQSVRELTQTGRSYRDVLISAALGVLEAGYTGPWGFDGDHLKSMEEVEAALDAGCTMLTIDLSQTLDLDAIGAGGERLDRFWEALPAEERRRWSAEYFDRRHVLSPEVAVLTGRVETMQTLATFYRSFHFLQEVNEAIQRSGREVDLEVSVDETGLDTTVEQHLILVKELNRRGIEIHSLAPKFVGEFQKGIDYRGNLEQLGENLTLHGKLARALGEYKLSIHSGSDKFAVFPLVEEATAGRYHLKTSGTFWLEAVRTVAQLCPETFRGIFGVAWDHFEEMLALYHVDARKEDIHPPGEQEDGYGRYLQEPASRQLLHVAYGQVLKVPALRAQLLDCLSRRRHSYLENIHAHTSGHLDALGVPQI